MPNGTPDKEINIRFLVKAQEAITEAEKFRQRIEDVKIQLRELSSQSGKSFKDIAEGMKAAFAKAKMAGGDPNLGPINVKAAKAEIKSYSKDVGVALREVQSETDKTGKSFLNLGNIISRVFGAFFIIKILRDVVRWLGEASQSGYEFVRAIFQLNVAVNALRRSGIDITFQQITENIEKLRQKFKIFSTKELIEGSAAFFNLNRDMGFTRDQLFELQDAIATLAVVNGRAMDEVQRTVALALSSGYTEGLQRLGVSINRVNIAQEAMRLGFGKTYLSLTEFQRGQATFNLVIGKTAKFGDDLSNIYKTLPGIIEASNASVEDSKRIVGENLLQTKAWIAQLKALLFRLMEIPGPMLYIANALRMLIDSMRAFGTALIQTNPQLKEFLRSIYELEKGVVKAAEKGEEKFIKFLAGAIRNLRDANPLFDKFIANLNKIRQERKLEIAEIEPPEDQEKVIEAAEKLIDELRDIEDDYASDRLKMERDLQRDLEKIDREGARRRIEVEFEYQRRLLEIRLDAGDDAYKLYAKYQFDLSQLSQDTQDKIADAQRRYRQKELEAERDYQEKLRRLREDFLFDLEDALRERDALQVIRLTRRYNLEKARLEREKNNEAQTRQEQYQNELKDIQDQRARRERELRAEYEFRLAEIRRQMAREIEMEAMKHRIELAELEESLKVQREERNLQHGIQMEELDIQTAERLRRIAEGIFNEYKLTKDGIDQLKLLVGAELGPGSYIDQVLAYLYLSAARASAAIKDALQFSGGIPKSMPKDITKETPGLASGGVFLAKKPTLIAAGEKEAEVVSAAPLSKIRQLLSMPISNGIGGSRDGKLGIELFLSPDLEARIMDNTMDQMSDVFVDIKRIRVR